VAGKNDPLVRRRDWQLEETRRDLALAAFELTREHGLANVRVPEIARAAMAAAERELGDAIAARMPAGGLLRARVLAAMIAGAERAAVMYWMAARSGSLAGTVRQAIEQAVAGISASP
jgi:hypothetical protein